MRPFGLHCARCYDQSSSFRLRARAFHPPFENRGLSSPFSVIHSPRGRKEPTCPTCPNIQRRPTHNCAWDSSVTQWHTLTPLVSSRPPWNAGYLCTLRVVADRAGRTTSACRFPARQALPGRKCNHPLQRGGAAPAGHGRPAGNVYRGSKHYCPSRWIFARL